MADERNETQEDARTMHGRIIVTWTIDLSDIGSPSPALAIDESPVFDFDPADAVAIASDNLGIAMMNVRPMLAEGDEVAAWSVEHALTGCPGKVAVIGVAS